MKEIILTNVMKYLTVRKIFTEMAKMHLQMVKKLS